MVIVPVVNHLMEQKWIILWIPTVYIKRSNSLFLAYI
jgi:hypothetical protein